MNKIPEMEKNPNNLVFKHIFEYIFFCPQNVWNFHLDVQSQTSK